MKLKYAMITMNMNNKYMTIAQNSKEFSGVINTNETGASIMKLLNKEISEEALVDALEKEYDVSRDVLIKDVRGLLAVLEKEGLLEK